MAWCLAAFACFASSGHAAEESAPPVQLQGTRKRRWNATGAWLARDEHSYPEDPSFAAGVARFLAQEKAMRVLDVGSGSGAIARVVADGANTFVLGVDGNPVTVAGGARTFPGGGRAEFRRVELDRPFPPDVGKFDWAMSFAVAEHVPFQYEHIFLSNLIGAARFGILLVWDQRDASGTGHINCRDPQEVLRLFTALGYSLDKEASAGLRASARLRWYKLAMVLRPNGQVTVPAGTAGVVDAAVQTQKCTQSTGECWYQRTLGLRAIADLAREEHQRACWPPEWSDLKKKCCSTGRLMAPDLDDAAPSSCFGAGFSFHVCCATMKDYYIF